MTSDPGGHSAPCRRAPARGDISQESPRTLRTGSARWSCSARRRSPRSSSSSSSASPRRSPGAGGGGRVRVPGRRGPAGGRGGGSLRARPRRPGAPSSPCGLSPQLCRSLDIARSLHMSALSSSYLCAMVTEVARRTASVASTTAGGSVWSPGSAWTEVRAPHSPQQPPSGCAGNVPEEQGVLALTLLLEVLEIRALPSWGGP